MFCYVFTDVLIENHREARAEINSRITRWLSGSRDRRAGGEPARKKSRVGTSAAPVQGGLPDSAIPSAISPDVTAQRPEGEQLTFHEL